MAERFDPAALISSIEMAGLSRAEFARKAGVDRSTITRLAAGSIRRPSHDLVVKLTSAADRVSRTQQK
jgi:transcriptional regulator with XRE-family HTH domain